MAPIVFLEVDEEDKSRVMEKFPDADIHQELITGNDLVEACNDAEIVSGFVHTEFPKEILEKLPNLKLIATRSVGFNHIDVDYCKEKGILICNVPDYGSHVIAEHVFALLLGTLRHVHEGDERVEHGEFDYHGLRGMALRGKTIGIIGTGKIGQKVAQIAHGFGMNILARDIYKVVQLEDLLGVQYVELPELFEKSDIITLHLPALEETHHIINSDALSQMKDGVVLVNTARGELIDSDALVDALKSGKVSYALLDVLEHETNFEENKELIAHPNAITTPHVAFYAEESMRNMYDDCFQTIDQWKSGETPEHLIKPLTVVQNG